MTVSYQQLEQLHTRQSELEQELVKLAGNILDVQSQLLTDELHEHPGRCPQCLEYGSFLAELSGSGEVTDNGCLPGFMFCRSCDFNFQVHLSIDRAIPLG